MLSATTQLFIFFIGCLFTVALAFGVVLPFVDAYPQVIVPGIIGGVIGIFCSVPLVAGLDSDWIWDFCIKLGIAPCIGITLGFAVGLIIGG